MAIFRTPLVRILGSTLLAATLLALPALAAAPAKSKNADVFMYEGPDREKRILEEAKREGTVKDSEFNDPAANPAGSIGG